MSNVPWNLIIPGLVEITKEIIGLFKSKRSNRAKRRRVEKFINQHYPDVKDHVANLLIEMVVFAHKQGLDESRTVEYVEGFLAWNEVWPKPKPVTAGSDEDA